MITWTWQATVAIAVVMSLAGVSRAADWTPDKWVNEKTLKLCTNVPEEGPYCFPVWLVVLDHEVYVRLGTKASGRVGKVSQRGAVSSRMAQEMLAVEIAGQKFDQVSPVLSPTAAKRVAAAMANKYWTDIIVRHLAHPMTVMLVPDFEVK